MITKRAEINIVWLKRDLRLHDHEPLFRALQQDVSVLIVYLFEPMLMDDPHYSDRHWNFIRQSIEDINSELKNFNTKVLSPYVDCIPFFNKLQEYHKVNTVFSHMETGLEVTFDRDKNFKRYCRNNLIEWQEYIHNGVERGRINRENWFESWNKFMARPQFEFKAETDKFLATEEISKLEALFEPIELQTEYDANFQRGGRDNAKKYLESFLQSRYKNYMFHISKPMLSRDSCSRLSPYLAWGNLSVREVYQKSKEVKKDNPAKRHLSAFMSRLRWQAHFIQKFEMEHIMEKASVNKGYHKLKKPISEEYQKAWKEGMTGFPLIDASMRCLQETGYLNFRMRAMLVSFFTHILWQPWQNATTHLSKLFLDFEPGIHFPQIQMQAGETGINNLRIYNPIKNGIEHDPDAEFIKRWVPELRELPKAFAHQPYLMTPLESQMYDFYPGKDYPMPIVDIDKNRSRASSILFGMKKDPKVRVESDRILKKHTLANRKRMLREP